ncbi:MAG TPA: hypothetical protein VMU98_06000 [Acidimicrobiales bacterium]|nr:hypothetical protein [Acidimicrobiales bacterium]
MSDVFERLTAADPYAGQTFELPDVVSFIARITATPRRTSAWRRFQLGVSGAVAATTLIMVGAIAALQGAAPSLPVLNFAAANTVQYNVYSSVKTSTSPLPTMNARGTAATVTRTNARYHFTASKTLSDAATVAPAYSLRAPNDPKAETTRLASAFGLSGSLQQLASATAWRVRSAGASLTLASRGLWAWSYVNPSARATGSARTTVPVRDLTRRATRLVHALGYDFQLATPTVTTGSATVSSPANSQQGYLSISLSFPVVVNGSSTRLTSDFTFSTSGALISAHGPAFYVASSYLYPLRTPVAGVAALNTERATLAHGPSSGGSFTANAPRAATIRLSTTSLALGAYQMSNGTLWLVPVYLFSVDAKGPRETWPLLAIDPRFTKNAASATPVGTPTPKH